MLNFIDTHTHIYAEEFDGDFDAVVARAEMVGVHKFIFPAIEKSSYERMMNAVQRFPQKMFPAIGLHPTSIQEDSYKAELDFVEQKLKEFPFVAIGEIGLDCYWTTETLALQQTVFERQLEIAAERNLPVIIHARNAFNQIFAILDRRSDLQTRGIFHAFAGTLDDYKKIKSYKRFLLGIGGIVTFKNSGLAAVVEQMNLNEIVLETDSPYLTPAPNRGKRNESANVVLIAQKIAQIKNVSIDVVAQQTTNNAENMFF